VLGIPILQYRKSYKIAFTLALEWGLQSGVVINLVAVGQPTPSVATVSGKNFTAVSQSWHLVRSSDASSERRDMILCIYLPM